LSIAAKTQNLNLKQKKYGELTLINTSLSNLHRWYEQVAKVFTTVKEELRLNHEKLLEKFEKYQTLEKFQKQSLDEKMTNIYHNCVYS